MGTNTLALTKRFEALSPPHHFMPQMASSLVLQALANKLATLEQKIDALTIHDPRFLATRPAQARPVRARHVESEEVQPQPVQSSPPADEPTVRVSRSRFLDLFD
jgi:hypothetical protein